MDLAQIFFRFVDGRSMTEKQEDVFDVDARDVTLCGLVKTEAELTSLDFASPSFPAFRPKYLYQIFGDTYRIKGYANPRLLILFTAISLRPYVQFTYDEKQPRADDVVGKLASHFSHVSWTYALSRFKEWLRDDLNRFQYMGAVSPYLSITPAHKAQHQGRMGYPNHSEIQYRICRCKLTTESDMDQYCNPPPFMDKVGMKAPLKKRKLTYTKETKEKEAFLKDSGPVTEDECLVMEFVFRRTQILVTMLIERGIKIHGDDRWDFYLLFEEVKVDNRILLSLAGICTLYRFYAFPGMRRLRISQFMILPPFQGLGLGKMLLNGIYDDCRTRAYNGIPVRDIVVEDPNPHFTFLRDLVDIENIITYRFFPSVTVHTPLEADQKEIAKVSSMLLLYPKQVERMALLIRYVRLEEGDAHGLSLFMVMAKVKLAIKYVDWLDQYQDDLAKKVELHKIYEEEIERPWSRIKQKVVSTLG